ncbi:EAL domain-containing protein [Vibrio sinaloensis]|nr:EAL domain-containing protein [Vibrio sinaloensis]
MLRLRENGFSVAIDDFGVSASTKERVLQIQPQILKLDRSILLKYLDGDQAPLLKSIQLAKSVGAQVVVEGIETEHQYDLMCQLEIDMYQGFFFSPCPNLFHACMSSPSVSQSHHRLSS